LIARRLLLALLIAVIVSGIFTFWLSTKFAHSRNSKSASLQYVATATDLDAGASLRAVDLVRIDWPSNMALAGAFLKPEDVVGRTLLYPLAKGEPILPRQLSAPGAGVGLSTKIPDGMRAISLKSGEVVGVAGFLLPGTRIDVLVTYHSPGSTEPITSTVLQDASILAAGQKMQPDPEGKPTTVDVVTLLVTPHDAERVVLASAQGTVHFVLRNGSDHAQVNDQPAQMSGLGEVAKEKSTPVRTRKVTASAPAPAPYSVETLRGDKHTVESF
jgi:pilus assembly protein CpaB